MDHDDFLQAIIEDSGDTTRLVYADWLEEQGDPRAEFIRVQCELAHLTEDDARWPRLKIREAELLERHQAEWIGPMRRLARDYGFRRGFVEVIALDGRDFLNHAGELFAWAPIEELRLIEGGRLIAQVAAVPLLSRLTALGLNGNYMDDAGAFALAASPHVSRLVRLNLGHNNIGDEGAIALAASPSLGELETLDLSHNRIARRGARALADSVHLPALTAISLRHNHLTGEDRDALRDHFGARQCLL